MKLRNSTDWPDHFIRRMLAWCRKEIELPAKALRSARFRNRKTAVHSGCGGWGEIIVSIGPDSFFPTKEYKCPGYPGMAPAYADRVEALVAITAHELTHVRVHERLRNKPMIRALRTGAHSERQTMYEMRRVLKLFQEQRGVLLAAWSAAPAERENKPKPSIVEQRAAKVLDSLSRWQRKLKLAQTKVRGLKKKAGYYERKAAVR